jgi:hypothetical protein
MTPAGLDAVFFFGVAFLDAVLSDAIFLEVVFFVVSSSDYKDKLVSSSSEVSGKVFFLVAAFFLLARFSLFVSASFDSLFVISVSLDSSLSVLALANAGLDIRLLKPIST